LKHIDEYRDKDLAASLSARIRTCVSRPWKLMEICGGQTHSIMKYGLTELLPEEITMIHGPGCPVCVTPAASIEQAIVLAGMEGKILTSFGDMLRVPGISGDLLSARSRGADVRMVYSPLDALKIAGENPDREVIFFAVGFETTAPTVALTVKEARRKELTNFSVLVSHVLVPPAMKALLSDPEMQIDGFLAAGHVCTVTGWREYIPIAEKYRIPIVVTGFEPVDILLGILRCTELLEQGKTGVINAYTRSVKEKGNTGAMALMKEVFEVSDRNWRGIGTLPLSGLSLRKEYTCFDACKRFGLKEIREEEGKPCVAGEILMGKKKPPECPSFGLDCKPEHPLGAPMVSSEGACAAYYRYQSIKTGK